MNITSTRLTPATRPVASSPSSLSVREDATPDSFSFSSSRRSPEAILKFAAIGVVGGAISGLAGPNGVMIPAGSAATGTLSAATSFAANSSSETRYPKAAVAGALGVVTGAVGGTLGLCLSAYAGLNPVAAGAIAGGVTNTVAGFLMS